MADIVPFGKYKNQPLATLAQDKGYCEWLAGQGWVAQRYPEIHTLIINNFAEPSETPEHNALQLRFLDYGLQLKVSMCLTLFHRPMRSWFKDEHYLPLIGCCTEPTFEVEGIDVQWEIAVWHPDYIQEIRRGPKTFCWMQHDVAISVECKPSLGDDYPAVLRFMHSLPKRKHDVLPRWNVVIVEGYSFRGGTIEQVHKLFQNSGVLLLDMQGLEALPAVEFAEEKDLPKAEEYINPRKV